ncbi:FtsX-like permease family protein [Streptomyces sp. NPDC051018]|uniref:ABC transporter permease n=1 Tax=Streptomyces sp. NPDC051018 TaxID=3365639 RepID=UPI0037AB1D7A
MFRLMRLHLTLHRARSTALLTGILVAVSAFVVLTATTESSRLTVTGTVSKNRGAYDILVRPGNAAQELEKAEGLIRPNSLSDIYGGITVDQVDTVRRVPGVDVAAPLAVLGHQPEAGAILVDLAQLVPKGTRGTFGLDRTWHYDRALSSTRQQRRTVFITPYRLEARPGPEVSRQHATAGVAEFHQTYRHFEILPSGQRREVCKSTARPEENTTRLVASVNCLSWAGITYKGLPDGIEQPAEGPLTWVAVNFPVSYLVAGVDPEAESELFGLDAAVTKGDYLASRAPARLRDRPADDPASAMQMLRSERTAGDLTLSLTLTRQGEDRPLLRKQYDAGTRYHEYPVGKVSDIGTGAFTATGPVTYDRAADGTLRPRRVERPARSGTLLPLDGQDAWFRGILPANRNVSGGTVLPEIVGTFDPGRLPEFDSTTRLPLGTYGEPALSGADERSRKLLGGGALRPASSPTAYVQQPPLMLVSMESVRWLAEYNHLSTHRQTVAPVSAIRVRVAGVTGADEVSRERVRVAAEEIRERTGLHVDIVLGSSPEARTVALPAGENGRPELRLTEWWSKKNVAARIVEASDAKSLLLLVLVLVVCTLFVANAAAASVRSRRQELGLLAAVGWRRRQLFAIVLGELLLLGTVAGLLGTAAARAAGLALGIDVPVVRALLAVPVALAVALVSGAVPAWLAARVQPVTALRPAVSTGRRTRMFAGVTGMALAGAVRARGRGLLGAAAVAAAAAATLLLIAATSTFRGTLAGSLLGETISVQVRSTDIAAVVTMVLLSTVAVGDVMYLGVEDRASEFALLRAVGWGEAVTARLVLLEGMLIGLLGAVAGTLLGGAAALWLAPGGGVGALLVPAAVVVVGGTVLSGAAGLVPVLIQRRGSPARLLAEE